MWAREVALQRLQAGSERGSKHGGPGAPTLPPLTLIGWLCHGTGLMAIALPHAPSGGAAGGGAPAPAPRALKQSGYCCARAATCARMRSASRAGATPHVCPCPKVMAMLRLPPGSWWQ